MDEELYTRDEIKTIIYRYRDSDGGMIDIFDRIERTIRSDPAMAERLMALARKAAPTFCTTLVECEGDRRTDRAFPALDTITAAQVTIFDNWAATGGKKPSRFKKEKGAQADRYVAEFEFWDGPVDQKLSRFTAVYRGRAALLDGAELTRKLTELAKPGKTRRPFADLGHGDTDGAAWAGYASELLGLVGVTSCRHGPFHGVNREGKRYQLGMYATVDALGLAQRDSATAMVLTTPTGSMVFSAFSERTSKGLPLANNAILSARISNRPDLVKNWRTAELMVA